MDTSQIDGIKLTNRLNQMIHYKTRSTTVNLFCEFYLLVYLVIWSKNSPNQVAIIQLIILLLTKLLEMSMVKENLPGAKIVLYKIVSRSFFFFFLVSALRPLD